MPVKPEQPALAARQASALFIEKVPIGFARRQVVLGLASDDERMPLAVTDAANLELVQNLSRFLRRPAQPLIAPAAEILAAINHAYQQRSGQAQTLLAGLDRGAVLDEVGELSAREDLLDAESRAPVIRLVNLMLFEAVKQGASDLHVQPQGEALVVRLRLDGVLYDTFDVPRNLQEEVVSRLKVMGRMNIAEKRLPQDGRATVQVGDRAVDLRIASLPTRYGERVVVRLLDKTNRMYTLDEIGMRPSTMMPFQQLIRREHGIVLVTGPTGSGKTTTLYGALQQLNAAERNILTLEDPIEYGLDGISQTQVNEKKGLTFASGLRNVLRQDPDVIMIGEIRDRETATMAIQSSLTGHLVFSTLHTNDAAGAITRLLDLGVEPYLVASSLSGVLAQRLLRRICPHCVTHRPPSPEERAVFGSSPPPVLAEGRGCDACRNTGYLGRLGIFELLTVDNAVRREISRRGTAGDIAAAARARGMQTLRGDALDRVTDGSTTLAEAWRVTAGDAPPEGV